MAQRGKMTARLLRGAAGLPISGRSLAIASLLRSEPFWSVNGAPVWNEVMPATDQPPKAYFHTPVRGPGTAHDHGLAAKLRATQLLDGRIERVEIDMHHDPLHAPILGVLVTSA